MPSSGHDRNFPRIAGLILAQMGYRPIILDRGKVVRERTKDTWGL